MATASRNSESQIMPNKNILLVEPGYKNKYPPLGLMKIASYHGQFGKNDNVRFIKGESDKSVLDIVWDRIYVTTLFSFEWKTISRAIDFAITASHNQPGKVFPSSRLFQMWESLQDPGWWELRIFLVYQWLLTPWYFWWSPRFAGWGNRLGNLSQCPGR